MNILYVKFQSEKAVIFISNCSLIIWTDVCQRFGDLNNEILLLFDVLKLFITLFGDIQEILFFFWASEVSFELSESSVFLKYKTFFSVSVFQNIIKTFFWENIRKFHFLKCKEFSVGVDFYFFSLGLEMQGSISGNIKKSFFWEYIRIL